MNIHLAKKTHLLSWIEIALGILNVGLNVLLIPSFGMHGAIIASLSTLALKVMLYLFIGNWVFSTYAIHLKYFLAYVALVLVFIYTHFLVQDIHIIFRMGMFILEIMGGMGVILFIIHYYFPDKFQLYSQLLLEKAWWRQL